MHERRTIEAALELYETGLSASEIGRTLGIPRSTVRDWLAGRRPRHAHGPGQTCATSHDLRRLAPGYVYLLGLYLGDGWLSTPGSRVPKLRIALDAQYPEIIAEARWAIGTVRGVPGNATRRPRNCVEVYSYWQHWPCLIPQHGPGKKHERRIALTDWQRELAERWPWELARGLLQSDGCRFLSTGRNWVAPRYAFRNKSADILRSFSNTCDAMGLHWTTAGPETIYVSRKRDVAILDRFVGPKW